MKKVKYGGITYGRSHKQGGIPVKNQSTGDMLEVEGGEGIVNKRSMASDKKVKLNGKEMTICEAVSQLNQLEGGVQFSCDDVSDRQFIEAMNLGGELERGTRTEAEHIQVLKDLYAKRITPKQAAKRIAKDHLKEDKRYYTKLAKMEGKMAEGGDVNKSFLKDFSNTVEAYQSNHYGSFNRDKLVETYMSLPISVKQKIQPRSTKNLFRGADGFDSKKSAISFTINKDYAKFFGAYTIPFSLVQEHEGLIDTRKLSNYLYDLGIQNEIGDDEGEVIVLNPIFKRGLEEKIENYRYADGGLVAPNGNKSNLNAEQYKLVRTKAFKDWFGDWENDPANASKVVDENGEPLVVYHGTASNFYIFKIGRTGGIFFSNNKNSAERFSIGDLKRLGETPKVIQCFLNIRKYYGKNTNDEIIIDDYYNNYFQDRPFISKLSQKNILKNKYTKYFMDLVSFGIVNEEAKQKIIYYKYDGIVIDADNNSKNYIVFEPNQIKLADGTNTTFDGSNPDIRFEDGGNIKSLIDSGVVELEIYDAPSEHAQQYGIDSQNPLYVKRIFIKDIERQKGLGNEVLMYLDQYAREHKHDAIFGHITQQAEPSIAIIKQMLTKNGYSTSTRNNDFWKEMDASSDSQFENGGKAKTDRSGNLIGDGNFHVPYKILDFSEYPQIGFRVDKSSSTESVYVTYYADNGKSIKVRFSNHENNAVKFGDELDGDFAGELEVLFHLGFAERVFVPYTQLVIDSRQIKKSLMKDYEMSDKTMKELYAMGEGADLSEYQGKLAKDSNYLILGNTVEKENMKGLDAMGREAFRGTYKYQRIPTMMNEKMKEGGQTKNNPFADMGLKKDFTGEWESKIDYFLKKSENFCDVEKKYCESSIDIDRADMPQIYEDYVPQYVDFLETQGINSYVDHSVEVGKLKPTQKNISVPRIKRMLERLLNGYYTDDSGKLMNPLKKMIIATKDGYLLDGHHRWASLLFLSPKNTVNVLRVDANIKDLVPISKNFGMVEFQKFMFGGKVMANENEPTDITKQKKLIVKRGGFPTKGISVAPLNKSGQFTNIGFTFSIANSNLVDNQAYTIANDLEQKLRKKYPSFNIMRRSAYADVLNAPSDLYMINIVDNNANEEGFLLTASKVGKTIEISILPFAKSMSLLKDDSFLDNVMDALNTLTKFPNAIQATKTKNTSVITVPAPSPRFYEENQKYRFKTEKELEFEFGKNWRDRFSLIKRMSNQFPKNYIGEKKYDFVLGRSIDLYKNDWIRFFSYGADFTLKQMKLPVFGKIKDDVKVFFNAFAITYDGFVEDQNEYNSAKRYRFLTKKECLEKGLNPEKILDSIHLETTPYYKTQGIATKEQLLLPEMLFGQIIPTPVFEWFQYLADLGLDPTKENTYGALGSVWNVSEVFDAKTQFDTPVINMIASVLIDQASGEYKDSFIYEKKQIEIPKALQNLIDFLLSTKIDAIGDRSLNNLRSLSYYTDVALTPKPTTSKGAYIGDLLGFGKLDNYSFNSIIEKIFPYNINIIFAYNAASPYVKEFTYEDESLSITPKIFSEENILFTHENRLFYGGLSSNSTDNEILEEGLEKYFRTKEDFTPNELNDFYGAIIPKPIFEFFRYANLINPYFGNQVYLGKPTSDPNLMYTSALENIAFAPSMKTTRLYLNSFQQLFPSLSLFEVLSGAGENGEDLYKWNLDSTVYKDDPINKTYAPYEIYNLCAFLSNGNQSWTTEEDIDFELWNIGLNKITTTLRFMSAVGMVNCGAIFFENDWDVKILSQTYKYKPSQNLFDKQINAIQTLMDSFEDDEIQVKGFLLKEIQKLRYEREKELQKIYYDGNLKNLMKLYASKISSEQRIANPNNGCGLVTPSGAPSELDLIQYKIVRSNEFKNWFGDWQLAYETKNYNGVSKAINPRTGEPMIMYHGKGNMQIEASKFGFGVFPLKYFGENYSYAHWFANAYDEMRVIYEFFVQVKNPIDFSKIELENITGDMFKTLVSALYGYEIKTPVLPQDRPTRIWQILRSNPLMLQEIRDNTEYDGFILYEDNPQDLLPNGERNRTLAFGTFKNQQSKSADGRNTTFFADSEDWRFKKGGVIKNKK